MNIRPLRLADAEGAAAFFARLPKDDLTFIKEDQLDAPKMRDWAVATDALRLVAEDANGRIAGMIAVTPGTGLSRHVGEVLLVVDAAKRRRGIGRSLVQAALVSAVRDLRLSKLFVEVVASQDAMVRMFGKLGFAVEALLRDHLRDRVGNKRDLILLCHLIDENWQDLAVLGIDGELG